MGDRSAPRQDTTRDYTVRVNMWERWPSHGPGGCTGPSLNDLMLPGREIQHPQTVFRCTSKHRFVRTQMYLTLGPNCNSPKKHCNPLETGERRRCLIQAATFVCHMLKRLRWDQTTRKLCSLRNSYRFLLHKRSRLKYTFLFLSDRETVILHRGITCLWKERESDFDTVGTMIGSTHS